MSQNVQTLFGAAQTGGDIGNQAAQVLAIPDLGAQIQAGLGVSVDDVMKSEVTLVTLLVDDSGSLDIITDEERKQAKKESRQPIPNSDHMIFGVNAILKALTASKQKDSILVSIRYLNGEVLSPYVLFEQVPNLDSQNYHANGGTPLYDQSVVICGQVIAKRQEFTDGGVACRAVTAIITDGGDMHSRRNTANDVAKVVRDMLATESHIVIGVGIDDGGRTDFRSVFSNMGIQNKWILTPGNSESEIRRAFAVVSQSAVRASQGAAGFSQATGAGFTSGLLIREY